ncbi:MAG: hypothetical protein UH963_09990 [Agathobacter sp.]|nr:hypothetical protein [Agathobacter sp.]
MANPNVELEDDELETKESKKERKKREKAEKKARKKAEKEEIDEYEDESYGSKLLLGFVTFLIIVIWLGIIAILIKCDVGGFGSSVLRPILKDVPYINKVLPSDGSKESETEGTELAYSSLDDAVARIKELEVELDESVSSEKKLNKKLKKLQEENENLMTYKTEQDKFEEEKEKFYEEVVFSDTAPDIEEYKSWYETIDAENAEVIYKQVVEQTTQDEQIKEYANTYSSMKAKEAAGIFDSMTDNLKLVAKILNAMDAQSRGDILGKMNPDTAAKVTKIMNPD